MKGVGDLPWMFRQSLLLVCLIGFAVQALAVDELAESRDRLDQLQKRIETTLLDLRAKQARAEDLDQELAALKREIQQVSRQVARSDRQLAELDKRVQAQQVVLERLETHQAQTAKQLRERLTALYKTSDVGLLKVLLVAAETPRALAEKYEFLSRMAHHDRHLIDSYRQQHVEQQQTLADLEDLRQKQRRLTDRRRKERQTLQSAQVSQEQLLSAVRRDEDVLAQMLDALRAKAARLNDLVKKLETEQAQTYTKKLPGLTGLKTHLPWPVPGKVKVGFGTIRHAELGTLIESHGLEIAAPVGTSVASIAAGEVIYASSLKGYGKLLIIDHGNKDYSLYAQVERFTKKVGDQISAGEQVAFSGHEGKESIYFEIRHGGQPLNPMEWLRPR